MSVFVPVVNGLNVGMQFTSEGDININQFWVSNSAAWTAGTIKSMLDAFITWYGTGDGAGNSYKAFMSSDLSLVSATGRDYTTQHGLVVVDQSGLPIVGGHAHSQIQLGCSKAFTARTGIAGKSYRGRTFACGIPTDEADAPDLGTVTSAYVTGMVNALNSLITAVTANLATAKLVVCSRFYQPGGPGTPSVPRAAGVTTPVTTFGYHDLFVDFQRRRAPGHARHH